MDAEAGDFCVFRDRDFRIDVVAHAPYVVESRELLYVEGLGPGWRPHRERLGRRSGNIGQGADGMPDPLLPLGMNGDRASTGVVRGTNCHLNAYGLVGREGERRFDGELFEVAAVRLVGCVKDEFQ
nr:hypothetical protein [Streptomyces sp. GESEQ-35]